MRKLDPLGKNCLKKGHPKLGGRKKGTPNKATLIEAELLALPEDEWVPYCAGLAAKKPRIYAKLLPKVLPRPIRPNRREF
jgi:hypothetical protein